MQELWKLGLALPLHQTEEEIMAFVGTLLFLAILGLFIWFIWWMER